jgi:hypothetical protein
LPIQRRLAFLRREANKDSATVNGSASYGWGSPLATGASLLPHSGKIARNDRIELAAQISRMDLANETDRTIYARWADILAEV